MYRRKTGSPYDALSRREREIVDILYRRGRATAAEVMDDLSHHPHYSTVRTQLKVLFEKGHVRYEEDGLRYVYMPAVPRRAARRASLAHLVRTFYGGSVVHVVADLLEHDPFRISGAEIEQIAATVVRAAQKGRIRSRPREAR